MTSVAIIGWGSLIWDLDDLAPKVAGVWALGAGPALPIEFARIPPKRLDALALCIDLDHGAPCRTAVIDSAKSSIAEAQIDLAERERAKSVAMIGRMIPTRPPMMIDHTFTGWSAESPSAMASATPFQA